MDEQLKLVHQTPYLLAVRKCVVVEAGGTTGKLVKYLVRKDHTNGPRHLCHPITVAV